MEETWRMQTQHRAAYTGPLTSSGPLQDAHKTMQRGRPDVCTRTKRRGWNKHDHRRKVGDSFHGVARGR